MRKMQAVFGSVFIAIIMGGTLVACPVPFELEELLTLQDLNAPQITIISPQEDSYFPASLQILGSVVDLDAEGNPSILSAPDSISSLSYTVRNTEISGTPTIALDGSFSITISTTGFDRSVSVDISAIDINGNKSVHSLRLLDDSRGPDLRIVSPEDLSVYGLDVVITGTVHNPDTLTSSSDVIRVEYEIVNSGQEAVPVAFDEDTGAFTFSFSTNGLTGDQIIRVMAYDLHGDSSSARLQLSDDKVGPNINITSPEDRSIFSKYVEVTGLVTDVAGGTSVFLVDLGSASYEVIGETPETALPLGGDGSFTFDIDTSGIADDILVRIVASDIHGTETVRLLELRSDGIGPAIHITSPIEFSAYGASVTVVGTVQNGVTAGSDASEVAAFSYQVLNTLLSAPIDFDDTLGGDGSYSFSFPTADLSGDLVIRLSATDVHGLVSTETLQLVNDGVGPCISVSSPAARSVYQKDVIVAGAVTDGVSLATTNLVASASWMVVGKTGLSGTLALGAGGSFSFAFDTTGISDDILILITAVDIHGTVSTFSLDLLSDRAGPYLVLSS
ncbi:MAG: hypothetical protein ABIJ86_05915, partial [Spirochaetota bacterium]